MIQTYQDTWTSQLFVLADYHNVAAADPDFAEKYTANQAKFAQRRRVKGFQRLQEVHKAGYENKDFASTKFEDGLRELAEGKGAHYPMLTFAVGQHRGDPEQDQGRRVLRAARRRRRQERADGVDAGRRLHPEDDRGRQARRGQEVRRRSSPARRAATSQAKAAPPAART